MNKYRNFIMTSALLLGGIASANASTILLGSYGTTALNPGFGNTATTYSSSLSTVNNGSNSTYNVSSGATWHAPTGISNYVSFDPGTSPTGSYVAPNGDYFYRSTFTMADADAQAVKVGTLTVLADDTVSIFLNGIMILQSGGAMGASNTYAECSDVGPNCRTPLTFAFSGIRAGVNELTFDVKQVNLVNEGLDYSGSISTIPEPASLTLLGTGLLSFVGFARRYAPK